MASIFYLLLIAFITSEHSPFNINGRRIGLKIPIGATEHIDHDAE